MAHEENAKHAAGPLQHAVEDCERVAVAIREVAKAAGGIVDGLLTERAVCVLIRDALPRGFKMEVGEIAQVLRTAAALGRIYTKAPAAKGGK